MKKFFKKIAQNTFLPLIVFYPDSTTSERFIIILHRKHTHTWLLL